MIDLNRRIEKKRAELNAAVAVNTVSKKVLKLSQQLDKLIVRKMRRDLA